MEFLSGETLQDKPVEDIQTVYGGGESNPDGSITLRKLDGSTFELYFENKTYRLGLSSEQLSSHLNRCDLHDRLLVITPRKSDLDIIRAMNNPQIRFYTWSEVASFIKATFQDTVAQHFVAYGRMSGEFEELGELHRDDIALYCEFRKLNYDGRIRSILKDFSIEVDPTRYGFSLLEKGFSESWGRIGVEINYDSKTNTGIGTYGQWYFFGYYHDEEDHGIPFKSEVPEIVAFFDVDSKHHDSLQNDEEFKELVSRLMDDGFESNLDYKMTNNKWRLLVYRKPITTFPVLNLREMLAFSEEVFGILKRHNARRHAYFREL